LDIPKNIEKYYPDSYLSLRPFISKNLVVKIAKHFRDYYAIFNKGFFGKILFDMFPNHSFRILSKIQLDKKRRILDVGSGRGYLLYSLKEFGFKNLLGVDPFIKQDIKYKNGLEILKKTIYEVNGKWDLIIFNHSFEHISDPIATIHYIKDILSNEGICLIKTPLVDSWAWENYGVNWVQIDAPRHFFIYSRKGIKILAEKTGFVIDKIICTSSEFQFLGSEQYKKDIPLHAENSYYSNKSKSIFPKKHINMFKKKAEEFNSEDIGDEGTIFISRHSL
jgi:SAM-dependent methyltransferase